MSIVAVLFIPFYMNVRHSVARQSTWNVGLRQCKSGCLRLMNISEQRLEVDLHLVNKKGLCLEFIASSTSPPDDPQRNRMQNKKRFVRRIDKK